MTTSEFIDNFKPCPPIPELASVWCEERHEAILRHIKTNLSEALNRVILEQPVGDLKQLVIGAVEAKLREVNQRLAELQS